ncbi:MAG: L,D-transpeptidase family protein [Fluviicola sp.]|nr:L,D-transpeptidase family protein [Fluviicola sp.]
MKTLKLISLLLLLFSCTAEEEVIVIVPFEEQEISVNEKIELAINEVYLAKNGFNDSTINFLRNFYASRDYSPKWINDSMLTTTGQDLVNVLPKSYSYGIPQGRFNWVETKNYIQDEINLTLVLAQVIHDLNEGIIDYDSIEKKPNQFISPDVLNAIEFSSETDIRMQLLNFGPQDSTSVALGQGLLNLVDNYPLDTTTYSIESIKYDSLLAVESTKIALISKGYLSDTITDSTIIIEALQSFQVDNGLKPDGVIGKYTSMALNESTYHKVERILLAMDKIRSRKERPEKYIYINIPEYKLRFYINDSLKSEHNIVVGKLENETPELTSKLRKLVIYPYWNVPYSISSKEILPHLKRNPEYLAKHNYVLLKKDEEVDPFSVDWSKVRENSFYYKVRQEPGPRNSLGIIKFDFYNKHSVYFHDTPSKSLFGVDVRAYSHGCMRTQNPVDLARAILERDEYRNKFNEMTLDSLDTLFARGENYELKLMKSIPIFIEYQSVVRKGDKMQMYIDIYGRDEEYLELMREE